MEADSPAAGRLHWRPEAWGIPVSLLWPRGTTQEADSPAAGRLHWGPEARGIPVSLLWPSGTIDPTTQGPGKTNHQPPVGRGTRRLAQQHRQTGQPLRRPTQQLSCLGETITLDEAYQLAPAVS